MHTVGLYTGDRHRKRVLILFSSNKHVYDVRFIQKNSIFGKKTVRATRSEQRAMKREILRKDPKARFIDEDSWIDGLFELDDILR